MAMSIVGHIRTQQDDFNSLTKSLIAEINAVQDKMDAAFDEACAAHAAIALKLNVAGPVTVVAPVVQTETVKTGT